MVMGPTRDLGPCILSFGGTDLGRTSGGCTFRFAENDQGVFEDQLGTGEVDDIVVGSTCEVEAPLSRMTLAKLQAVIAGSSGSGTDSGSMTVKSCVGRSRYDTAKELILKPLLTNGAVDPDTSKWLHVFKAAPRADFEVVYNNEKQRVYKVMFKGYPDQSTGVPAFQIWRIGPAVA